MARIFILATKTAKERFIAEATKWIEEPNQVKLSGCKSMAIDIAAEYIANQLGLTMYSINAKYK